nr:hypothetical protein GCM10020093_012210 [Planobispora longispora]
MTAWHEVEQAEPEFARRVRALFDARRHKTIATLRADGAPRISGIEAVFENGELVFGSMPNARKGADLRRDPRFALHSATVDPVEGSEAQWPGEAKISGRAVAAGSTAGDRTATASTPTSPRSCTPTSTTRPRCSSSSGGRPSTGCGGPSAGDPPGSGSGASTSTRHPAAGVLGSEMSYGGAKIGRWGRRDAADVSDVPDVPDGRK